jgi:hypothetical protein
VIGVRQRRLVGRRRVVVSDVALLAVDLVVAVVAVVAVSSVAVGSGGAGSIGGDVVVAVIFAVHHQAS